MTFSNCFLVVLTCFQKQGHNHESTGRSLSRWVTLHISENGFSISGGSWSTTLILRPINNTVSMRLWQSNEKDEQFLTSHQSKAIPGTALDLVEGHVFKTLMGSSRVHMVTHFSFLPAQYPLPFPPSSCRERRISCPGWTCCLGAVHLFSGRSLLTGAHCNNGNRNHSWLLLTGQMKNY